MVQGVSVKGECVIRRRIDTRSERARKNLRVLGSAGRQNESVGAYSIIFCLGYKRPHDATNIKSFPLRVGSTATLLCLNSKLTTSTSWRIEWPSPCTSRGISIYLGIERTIYLDGRCKDPATHRAEAEFQSPWLVTCRANLVPGDGSSH